MTPINQIAEFLQQLKARSLLAPLCLSTLRRDGSPASRFVDLKEVEGNSLLFATDDRSAKAREFTADSRVAAAAWWEALQVQVRVAGRVAAASDAIGDRLFSGRGVTAQAIATLSVQSEPLDSLEALRTGVAELLKTGSALRRPSTWRAYALVPNEIEILRFAPDRIHTRTHYRRESGEWIARLLSP